MMKLFVAPALPATPPYTGELEIEAANARKHSHAGHRH